MALPWNNVATSNMAVSVNDDGTALYVMLYYQVNGKTYVYTSSKTTFYFYNVFSSKMHTYSHQCLSNGHISYSLSTIKTCHNVQYLVPAFETTVQYSIELCTDLQITTPTVPAFSPYMIGSTYYVNITSHFYSVLPPRVNVSRFLFLTSDGRQYLSLTFTQSTSSFDVVSPGARSLDL